MQERDDVTGKEIDDGLPHDLERERVAGVGGDEPALLVHYPVRQFGQFDLTTREAAHLQRPDPIHTWENC